MAGGFVGGKRYSKESLLQEEGVYVEGQGRHQVSVRICHCTVPGVCNALRLNGFRVFPGVSVSGVREVDPYRYRCKVTL